MSATRLPEVGAIVQELVSAATSRPMAEERGDAIVALALRLHQNNRLQWDREDDARRLDADDAAVAAAKRDIDRMNGVRHGLIEAIDRAFLEVIPPVDERAPLVTESPGMVIDRVSVLVLRVESTEARASAPIPSAIDYVGRLPRLRIQLGLLEQAAAILFGDLESGRCRFVTYESLKLYGSGGARGDP